MDAKIKTKKKIQIEAPPEESAPSKKSAPLA